MSHSQKPLSKDEGFGKALHALLTVYRIRLWPDSAGEVIMVQEEEPEGDDDPLDHILDCRS